MKKVKHFFDRLAKSNKKQFGRGRLNISKINAETMNNKLPQPHLSRIGQYPLDLPNHQILLPPYEAMKLADVLYPSKCDICHIGSPYQPC